MERCSNIGRGRGRFFFSEANLSAVLNIREKLEQTAQIFNIEWINIKKGWKGWGIENRDDKIEEIRELSQPKSEELSDSINTTRRRYKHTNKMGPKNKQRREEKARVVVPTCGMQMWLGSVTASRIFPTLNVTAHLKTLFCYRKKFIAHPATTLRATRR